MGTQAQRSHDPQEPTLTDIQRKAMPPAYILVDVEVNNSDAFEAYRLNAPETIGRYGGEYLVRGGAYETLEGEPPLGRIVVIRFADEAAARAWYGSAEYKDLRALRQAHARTNMVLVQGIK
jgi:uncharacterized protein (DUF1330 family)